MEYHASDATSQPQPLTKTAKVSTLRPYPYYRWTQLFRVVVVLLGLAYWLYRSPIDERIDRLWQGMRLTWFVRFDTCEPIVAAYAFIVWVNMFRFFDAFCPFLQRFRIIQTVPSRVERLWVNGEVGHGTFSYFAFLVPMLVFDYFHPRRVLPAWTPTLGQLVGQVALSVLVYDCLFYGIHTLYHRWPAVASLHAKHHSMKPLAGSDVVRVSVIDGLSQVLCSAAAVNICRSHSLARLLHNVVITYLLTEAHSQYDFPWSIHRLLPSGLMGGPIRHEIHHHTGKAYFSQFFSFLDRWSGNELSEAELDVALQDFAWRP
ncbi:unnamed protein product [Vitrella brassicaformis CCMP3155]|uniref:Fatty acid hydroxylase domain-containing protein n=1 Tax=Vitrella brassicaformis (strain CCMP3155) TaxID=1169540 RepID=A0A0G4FU03_VITBC|nr:unnamed protein product [Vitrella brassicaformis CCMP3155]|eukprot:CEM18011.1 unnamed protein product [Vitrella brassicaformis CCMP3155]